MLVPGFTAAWTFAGCANLRAVTVDDGVRTLPPGAFSACSQLSSITIPRSVTSLGMLVDPPASAWTIFEGCTNLTGMYFEGNSPSLLSGLIDGPPGHTTVYYLPGTTGWRPTYGGCPTALWTPQAQTAFGVGTTGFGFNIIWARDRVVVVEASTNLVNPVWSPVSTSTLTSGRSYVSDAEWINHPSRFYRFRAW